MYWAEVSSSEDMVINDDSSKASLYIYSKDVDKLSLRPVNLLVIGGIILYCYITKGKT